MLRAGDIDPKTGRKILGLTSEPEIKSFHLTEEDEFLLIACDGLWDVMKPENSVTLARCVAAFDQGHEGASGEISCLHC